MRRAANRGFTLIELMITVAIVGILAAVAYPSFTQYFVRAKRSAAQSFMHSVANKQEQYMLDRRSYAADLATLNVSAPADVSANYTITVTSDMTTTPPSYLVTATPIGAQLTNDTQCGTLTINHLGTKAPATSGCW